MANRGNRLILLAAALGGMGFIGLKVLLNTGYTPYQIIFGRFLIASAALSVIYGKEYSKITKSEWCSGAVAGVFLMSMFVLLTVGLQYTTPSVNAFLCNIPAVLVPFICWIFFRQRPRKKELGAGLLTVIGVAMLSVTDGLRLDLGAVLSFLAAVAFAFQVAFLGRFLVGKDALHLALAEHLTVLVLAFALTCFTGWKMPAFQWSSLGHIAYVGLFCTAAYFVLQSVGQKYTSASNASVIITTESIFAAIFAAVFYEERLSLRGYIGCALIFAAVLWAGREAPQKEQIEA